MHIPGAHIVVDLGGLLPTGGGHGDGLTGAQPGGRIGEVLSHVLREIILHIGNIGGSGV